MLMNISTQYSFPQFLARSDMSCQMNTKVRFVRCPKCRLVLPELAEVPVYKCGGCGTILQAKNRKAAPINNNGGLDAVSHEKEISNASREASPPPKDDISLNKRKKSGQGGVEDCNNELIAVRNSPDVLPSSSGLGCDENEDPSSKSPEYINGDEHCCTLDEKTEGYENGYSDHQKKFSGGSIFLKLPSSDQLNCHESESPFIEPKQDAEGSALEEREKLVLDKDTGYPTLETKQEVEGLALEDTQLGLVEDNCPVDHCIVEDKNKSSTFSGCSNHRDLSIRSGAHQEDGIERKSLLQESMGRGENDFQGLNAEPSLDVSYAKVASLPTELACAEIDKQSSVCSDTYRSSLNESTISDTLMSTDHEHLEQFQKEIPSVFDRTSSVDTLENLPLNICGSEPPVNLGNVKKSPTSRSYYAYDGSASSCDDDDHIPNQCHLQPGRMFKESAYSISSSELHAGDRCRVNNTMSTESTIVQQAMNYSMTLPGRSYHDSEGSNWGHHKWPQSRKRGQASGSRMTMDKDEHSTAFPFNSTGSHSGHKLGNPSSYPKNMPHHSSLHSSRIPSNSETDKMELLRMVYELEDQLRQTRIGKRMANRQFSSELMRDEEHTPLHYDQFLAEGKVSADVNYSGYPVRCSHRKGWPQQRNRSRVPFSAEAVHYRHQADCLCLICSPQVRHFSAQLPPPVCCNKGRGAGYSSYDYCNHLHSSSSSPQHYSSSEYSRWDHDTKFDNKRHKDHEMKKLHLRERYSRMRHLRPVAGGAPIIACYYCTELLQLPADFLLFKRRCHELRCNACRKVLKFSLKNQIHVVPFHAAEALAPPPSEVDDDSYVIDQHNLASAYHSNSCPHTEPISCSDDLGPSFCRSYSTEGESSLPPIHPLGRTSFNREMPHSSSFAPTKDRKIKSVLREVHSNFEPAGPSVKISKWSKASSEIDEVRESAGSPLHWLMGYSSPSEVIQW